MKKMFKKRETFYRIIQMNPKISNNNDQICVTGRIIIIVPVLPITLLYEVITLASSYPIYNVGMIRV